MFLFLFSLLFGGISVNANCVSNISSVLNLEPYHYNGSWFVIARKGPLVDYLPKEINSSLIRLTADGRDLIMEEYHSINGSCMPTVHGRWRKLNDSDAFSMEVRNPTGNSFQIFIRPIFHTFSGEQNEEMNMVLYGCRVITEDKKCAPGEQLTSILSNSRHPQTLALFQSAKHMEDNACVDVLELKTLSTYTSCGDDVVDEDQKMKHAQIDEDNTFVDVECRVENWKQFVPIGTFFNEPRVLTVVAYMDPVMDDEQVAHISCIYSSTTEAECEWIRQRTCFKTKLTQSVEGTSRVVASTQFTHVNGSAGVIDLTGNVIWQNGDEFVTVECLHVEEDDGSCEVYRVYVWSDEDHMDQPTLREIYSSLHAFCIDPSELIFLNTFHECHNESEESHAECGEPIGWTPVNVDILQGSWYFAADVNADPKIFMQSTVIQLTAAENDTSLMHLTYYAQKAKKLDENNECIGPGNGTVRLLDNSTLEVTIEYSYKLVPSYRNTIRFNTSIIYLDNQRMLLYRCFHVAENGTCTQKDLDILIRSRYVSPNDISLLMPYLERSCVTRSMLRWFDLHSRCGTDVIVSASVRRDMVTMTHSQVLDILTNVQEPRCHYGRLRGVRTDLDIMEKAGVWYLISVWDTLPLDTYAMIFRVIKVSDNAAVVRMLQSAAYPGEQKHCYTRVLSILGWEGMNEKGETDWLYEMHYEYRNRSAVMRLRFMFFNGHVGVLYSCSGWDANGECEEPGLYVISRHQTIDHAELAVLETVSRAVCMDPSKLYHTARHDACVFDVTKVKLPACASIEAASEESFIQTSTDLMFWNGLNDTADKIWEDAVNAEYGDEATAWPVLYDNSTADDGVYYAIAADKADSTPVVLIRNGSDFVKVFETNSGCGLSPVVVRILQSNPTVAFVGSQLLVLSRHPSPPNAELLQMSAQRSSSMPCLHRIEHPPFSKCSILQAPKCATSEPIRMAEQLHGSWELYSSDPYVSANSRCKVSSPSIDEFLFVCSSESWRGECEREVSTRLRADAWGGYSRIVSPPEGEEEEEKREGVPVRTPSELFDRGNITVSDNFLLLVSDDALVGRRYSLWLRSGGQSRTMKEASPRPLTRRDAREVGRYCVRVTEGHKRTRESICDPNTNGNSSS